MHHPIHLPARVYSGKQLKNRNTIVLSGVGLVREILKHSVAERMKSTLLYVVSFSGKIIRQSQELVNCESSYPFGIAYKEETEKVGKALRSSTM